MTDPIPRAELLEDLRRLRDVLGRAPTASEITSLGQYGYTTYYRRFGGVPEACLEAGITTNQRDPWRRKAQELREAVRESETAEIDIDDHGTEPSTS